MNNFDRTCQAAKIGRSSGLNIQNILAFTPSAIVLPRMKHLSTVSVVIRPVEAFLSLTYVHLGPVEGAKDAP
jgi:hypothetical protein